MSLITVKNIKKYYLIEKHFFHREKNKYVRALDDVSLTIEPGEILGVVGESGSGKSTLGRCIIQLEHINEGKIYFADKPVYKLEKNSIKEMRKKNQMVFQNPYSSFNPKMTIGATLREIGKVHKMGKKQTDERIAELLKLVNLTEDYLDRAPSELSGGQLQRLAIVKALILYPDFVVADEAVSALDVSVQAQILNLFMDLKEKLGLTILFISHDLNVVERICDRVVVLYLGKIVEMATAKQIYENTLHPYTKALIASKPKSHPDEVSGDDGMKGEIPNAVEVGEKCRFFDRCSKAKEGLCDCKVPELKEVEEGHYVACHLV